MSNWKNVNNWHWTDKNCINWAKSYFKDRLANVAVDYNGYHVTTEDVTSVTGDCDLNQRKGKVITIFDLEIKLNWSGTGPDGTEAAGSIHIPEVTHDADTSDYVFDITITAETREKREIKEVVRKQLTQVLRERLAAFRGDLIESHRKDVYIDPDQLGTPTPPAMPRVAKPAHEPTSVKAPSAGSSGGAAPVAVTNTVTVDETVEFVTSAAELYTTLTDPARIAAWTRSAPQFEARVGGRFSFFGGNVTGENEQLEPSRSIKQKWRLSSWPQGYYSQVSIDLDQTESGVRLHLRQTGVPVGDEDQTKSNWHQFYWQSIKSTFGFGAVF
ncbi:Co-chaperone [Dimargaris cristalligena]|uniref:Activator of Hsp90 ATPase n=1 Tax=Dimargaris cristalligena TaxID=215637 RepID=A0A4P9ZVM0_9FUNG|nr:Co-chaperone [Dimargaris cristalligena]RKP36892.1 activator of Hsp90 ATPase [Dimargaris cristalligena]|eukprot:RKP36892.1 activator of Hsp90 ATPase [Dimargaris cristalligena]